MSFYMVSERFGLVIEISRGAPRLIIISSHILAFRRSVANGYLRGTKDRAVPEPN